MRPQWDEISSLFAILGSMVQNSDHDGIDLYFTMTAKGSIGRDTNKCRHTVAQWKPSLGSLQKITVRGQATLAVGGTTSYLPKEDASPKQLWDLTLEAFDHLDHEPFLNIGRYLSILFDTVSERVWQNTETEIEPTFERIQFKRSSTDGCEQTPSYEYKAGMFGRFDHTAQYAASRRLSGVDNRSLSKRKRTPGHDSESEYNCWTIPKEYVHSTMSIPKEPQLISNARAYLPKGTRQFNVEDITGKTIIKSKIPDMACSLCPGSGSAAEKSFNRAIFFERHLRSLHRVEDIPATMISSFHPESSYLEVQVLVLRIARLDDGSWILLQPSLELNCWLAQRDLIFRLRDQHNRQLPCGI
jgi:hypothetical protein